MELTCQQLSVGCRACELVYQQQIPHHFTTLTLIQTSHRVAAHLLLPTLKEKNEIRFYSFTTECNYFGICEHVDTALCYVGRCADSLETCTLTTEDM